jgi:hypothetical protein
MQKGQMQRAEGKGEGTRVQFKARKRTGTIPEQWKRTVSEMERVPEATTSFILFFIF